jgi:hypothetical protein
MRHEPGSPPIVRVDEETVAYLLCWDQHDRDGSWWAWVTWIREASGRPRRHVANVRAEQLAPLKVPEAYQQVPRRVFGADGKMRYWLPGEPRPAPDPPAGAAEAGGAPPGTAHRPR